MGDGDPQAGLLTLTGGHWGSPGGHPVLGH